MRALLRHQICQSTSVTTEPVDLAATRNALHAVAEHVLAAVRVQATGNEIALAARDGGVGTPDLPGGGWVGFTRGDLVVVGADGAVVRTPLTTLRAAGRAAGLHAADALDDEPLGIDADAAAFLDDVYAFADSVLNRLHDEAEDASEIRLWPEHFDIAFEQGDEAAGRRAGYGVSPGDDSHAEPYAYVTPWTPPPPDASLWNATGFTGAELRWSAIAAEVDPAGAVLAFWRTRRDALS